MTYPAIELEKAIKIRDGLKAAQSEGASLDDLISDSMVPDFESSVTMRGTVEFDADRVAEVATRELARWRELREQLGVDFRQHNLWGLEESMAEPVHRCLRHVGVEALSDPDFWRYLHLGPFRWYLLEREPEMKPHDYGGNRRTPKSWLLNRTFLWGALAVDDADPNSPYRLATAVGEAGLRSNGRRGKVIDFWHSHLIRVSFASTNRISRAFIEAATNDPVALNDDARQFEKRMLRISRSVALGVVGEPSLAQMTNEQKMRALEDARKKRALEDARKKRALEESSL